MCRRGAGAGGFFSFLFAFFLRLAIAFLQVIHGRLENVGVG